METLSWVFLRSETSQKSFLKIFCYNNKVTRKGKYFQKLSNKEIYFSLAFKLILLNTANFSNSFHGQTSMKDTIFSVLISGVKLSLSSWKWSDG